MFGHYRVLVLLLEGGLSYERHRDVPCLTWWCKIVLSLTLSVLWAKCYAMLMRPNKSEAVHGCHWLCDMVVSFLFCVIWLSLSYLSLSRSPLGINFSDNNPYSYEQYLSSSKLITMMIPFTETETVSICSSNTCIHYTSSNSSSFVTGRGSESEKKFRVYAAFYPRLLFL